LEISLKEASIDDGETYYAVLYTWADENGNRELSGVIVCDEAYIAVTSNCEAALRLFRDTGPKKRQQALWVDAICINQSDIVERNQQIPLMKEIYAKSRAVLVWLDNASTDLDPETSRPYTDIAVDFLKCLGDNTRTGYNTDMEHRSSYYEDLLERTAVNEWTSRDTLPLILGYRWWKRGWVLQELAFAPSALFFCGEK
jgi:hypothetical protein